MKREWLVCVVVRRWQTLKTVCNENAPSAFWIKMGMLCELNPGLSFQELMARELKAAGVDAPPVAA